MLKCYSNSIGGVFLPPDGYLISYSSQVITNLSCSLDYFINFEESCEYEFTDDEECLNHTMDLILQCSFGKLWIDCLRDL